MSLLRTRSFDRIQLNALLVVSSFVAVLTLSSQSAASYPTYLLGISMLVSVKQWNDVFRSRLIWIVLAVIGYLCLSSLWSEPFTLRDVTSILTRGILVFCFIVALAECQLRGQVQRWMGRLIGVAGALVATIAVFDFVLHPPITGRLSGFGQLDHPVVAGLILSVVTVFLLQLLLSERSTSWKSMALVGLIPVSIAIALTGSRNAWACSVVGALVYLSTRFMRDHGKFPVAIIGMLIIVAALIAGIALNEDTVELLLPRGDSFRIDIWRTVWDRWVETNLFFGVGITTADDIELSGQVFQHPHNMYLAVALQGGLVGLVLFITLILFTLVSAYRCYEHPDAKLSLSLMAIALFSYLLDGHELVDKVGETWFLFWLPVALSVGLSWNYPGNTRDRVGD